MKLKLIDGWSRELHGVSIFVNVAPIPMSRLVKPADAEAINERA
jgi:hypothetical protein